MAEMTWEDQFKVHERDFDHYSKQGETHLESCDIKGLLRDSRFLSVTVESLGRTCDTIRNLRRAQGVELTSEDREEIHRCSMKAVDYGNKLETQLDRWGDKVRKKKNESANDIYNLMHTNRELRHAKKDRDQDRIDFWENRLSGIIDVVPYGKVKPEQDPDRRTSIENKMKNVLGKDYHYTVSVLPDGSKRHIVQNQFTQFEPIDVGSEEEVLAALKSFRKEKRKDALSSRFVVPISGTKSQPVYSEKAKRWRF